MLSPASPRCFSSFCILLLVISMVGLAHIAGGGILPSPTSDLNVSGMILEIDRHQLGGTGHIWCEEELAR